MRTGKVTKKKAEELAKQLLGTGQLMKEDEYGYYFQPGQKKCLENLLVPLHMPRRYPYFYLAGLN